MKNLLIALALTAGGAASADMGALKGATMDKAKGAAVETAKKIAAACKEEKVKFCKDKELDALKACLVENKANLSPGCKSSVGVM